jgi:alkylation response protein AidB-like acyl-CoA dehydrogenase
VEGGYRLSGEWSFASGLHHANWLGASCELSTADGAPLRGNDGQPEKAMLVIPFGEAEILEQWDVNGLLGTGSDGYRVRDLFVPETYAARLPLEQPHEPGPLYLFVGGPSFISAFAVGFAAVALGVARATLDAFEELARTKNPRGLRGVLREQAIVQAAVGQGEGSLRAARAYLRETVADVWECVSRTGELTIEQRVRIRLAASHAIAAGTQVVDTAYHAAGSTAIFRAYPFERRFRDAHAVAQHVQGRPEHFETAGSFFVGLEPATEWL